MQSDTQTLTQVPIPDDGPLNAEECLDRLLYNLLASRKHLMCTWRECVDKRWDCGPKHSHMLSKFYVFLQIKKVCFVYKQLNIREIFWKDEGGKDHWQRACGILKSYWTMRNYDCVDKSYFNTQREKASGPTKHDNMHAYVSFGTHPLCVRASIYFGFPYLLDTC